MRASLEGQYQKVALALAAGVREGRLSSVVFTGPTKKQGTTSTVLNVARQLKVSCGINPLVVELNRFRPTFVSRFALDERKSVAAVAEGKCSRECIQHLMGGLSVIPVGDFSSMQQRANFELTGAVGRIQKELRGTYPLFLWDAPPALERPDVLSLHAVLTNAVLVVESGHSSREVLERICEEFQAAGINLEGTVMVKHTKPIPGWIYRWLVH